MPHIVKSFDEKLAQLNGLIHSMGELAAVQLWRAITALEQLDGALAQEVIAGDAKIDALHQQVSDQVVLVLALRAPMADDLRTVIAALKVSGDIERIADHARSIAKRALVLKDVALRPSTHALAHMGKLVHQLVQEVMDAYDRGDVEKALAVWHQDRFIDELYSGAFRELLTYMMEDSRLLAACTQMVFLAKDIERIGDHATNIGEMVSYRATGQTLAKARPKADTTAERQIEE